jgi:hypothetical protein
MSLLMHAVTLQNTLAHTHLFPSLIPTPRCCLCCPSRQLVIFLVQHSDTEGSIGLILNRPSALTLGLQKRGGLPFQIIGAPDGMQAAFAENRVYAGGYTRQDVSRQQTGSGEGTTSMSNGVVCYHQPDLRNRLPLIVPLTAPRCLPCSLLKSIAVLI